MNIHPIFVHFPIALLTIYALLELVPFKKITLQPYWFYLKATFVIFGTFGAFVALQTGEMAQHIVQGADNRRLIHVHSNWATASSWIFGLIALAYLVSWTRRATTKDCGAIPYIGWLWKILLIFEDLLIRRRLVIILAVCGLIAITITGALGGAIAFGPEIDPAAQFFYNLLVK